MVPVERFSATVQPRDNPGPTILAALEAAERFAQRAALAPATLARLRIVVEELVSNALRHGCNGNAVAIELALTADNGAVILDLADNCSAFDPTERRFDGPDRESGGGVGLELVRSWTRDIAYAHDGERNILRATLPA